MSYRQDLKRLRRARRQAKRQQQQLATAELDGIIGVALLTLKGWLVLPVPTPGVATDLTEALWQGLVERRRQLEADMRRVQRDWYEHETQPGLPPELTT